MAISCACLSCRSEAKAAHSCACHHQLARDSSRTVWTLGAVAPRELFIRLGAFRPRDPFAYLYFKNIKNAVKCYYLYYVSPLIKLVWITSPNVILLEQYKRRCPQPLLSGKGERISWDTLKKIDYTGETVDAPDNYSPFRRWALNVTLKGAVLELGIKKGVRSWVR